MWKKVITMLDAVIKKTCGVLEDGFCYKKLLFGAVNEKSQQKLEQVLK